MKKNNLNSQTNSSLTVIILNYNTMAWMQRVLTSIKRFHLDVTDHPTEVVMVDNGSQDDSVLTVRREFPWVKIIEAGVNNGFAVGNNLALKQVTTTYAMLLNSDTEFTQRTQLDGLLEFMDQHPQVGVVTPRLELADGQLDFASHRGEPTPWASLMYFSKLAKVFPHTKFFAQYHQTYLDLRTTHQIDACSGAAMMVRSSALAEVGLLDEAFFMYAEDLDWCKRFREAGYQIMFVPTSVITHHKYQSGRGNQNQKLAKKTARHFYQTMLQYYDKHYRTRYPAFVRWGIQLFIQLKQGVL